MPDAPSNDLRPLSVREVHDEFDRLLRDRHHMGMRNLLGDAILEPRNPFQNARRGAKRWVIAVLRDCPPRRSDLRLLSFEIEVRVCKTTRTSHTAHR